MRSGCGNHIRYESIIVTTITVGSSIPMSISMTLITVRNTTDNIAVDSTLFVALWPLSWSRLEGVTVLGPQVSPGCQLSSEP